MIKATKCGLKKKKKLKNQLVIIVAWYPVFLRVFYEYYLFVNWAENQATVKRFWRVSLESCARAIQTVCIKTVKKGKGAHEPKAHTAGAYHVPASVPWSKPRSIALPYGRDASPSPGYSPRQYIAGTHTIYTPGWRETKWSKVLCLRKQRNRWGLNTGPPDLEFEVLTARP